jgi:multidrug transporter EmrE-like cation transporter
MASAASCWAAIPLVAGLVLFGERLGRWQLLGVVLIITGLVLIGLG